MAPGGVRRSVARAGWAALCVAMSLGPVVLGAGAASAGEPTATAAQYLEEVHEDAAVIAAHIGHGLALPEHVVVNKTQAIDPNDPAYTFVFDAAGETNGTPASCVTYINPSFDKEDAAYQTLALYHEVFHCFEAMDFSNLDAFYAAPKWLIEGEAEWVSATLAPTELDSEWKSYLTGIDTSLFSRSYDAIGFYAHLTNSGEDTWRLLDPMLKAPSSAAAYAVGAGTEARLTWASSLARQPSLGKGWQTTGPGITSAAYGSSLDNIALGTKVTDTVDPYTNDVLRFRATTADVIDVSVSTPYSRLHTSSGTEYDDVTKAPASFCVQKCDECPQLEKLPKLSMGGTNWLAVTGDTTGASYTITGLPAQCQPCLVGDWYASNVTLTVTPGGTWTGGVGTTVDIGEDGDALGDFDPGTDLTGATTIKFGGEETERYSFSPTTTALSGPLTATPVSSSATITELGGTTAITPEVETGSYTCSGSDLTVTLSAGPSTITYDLVPAG
jgi:hypothetical protein